MRTLVIGGVASSGKTAVLMHLARATSGLGLMGVVKVDCLLSSDDKLYTKAQIPSLKILADRFCPDHILFENVEKILEWGREQGLETLAIETAGLCGRCAPYGTDCLAICVLDCSMGVFAPAKLGPLLSDADICVITKTDLVSRAEVEVFELAIRERCKAGPLVRVNGLTGEGAVELSELITRCAKRPSFGRPRTPLPQLYCSYCLGRMEAGITVL